MSKKSRKDTRLNSVHNPICIRPTSVALAICYSLHKQIIPAIWIPYDIYHINRYSKVMV